MSNDLAPDANAAVQAILGPIIQQATGQAQAALADTVNHAHAESLTLISGLAERVTANEQGIQDALAKAGTSVLTSVESDPVTQRILVCSVVGALLVAALLILIFALQGNATANKWIGAAPAIGVAVLAWVSKAGVALPKPKAS